MSGHRTGTILLLLQCSVLVYQESCSSLLNVIFPPRNSQQCQSAWKQTPPRSVLSPALLRSDTQLSN